MAKDSDTGGITITDEGNVTISAETVVTKMTTSSFNIVVGDEYIGSVESGWELPPKGTEDSADMGLKVTGETNVDKSETPEGE